MSPVVQVVITALVSVLSCGGLWTYLDHRRAERQARKRVETEIERAQREVIVAIARNELIRTCLAIIATGTITVEEADALSELFTPYEILGGNGNGKRLYEQAVSLPRRTGRTADRKEAP